MPDRVQSTRLRGGDLPYPGGRIIHAKSDYAAVAVGTPRLIESGRSNRSSWTVHAASTPGYGIFMAGPEPSKSGQAAESLAADVLNLKPLSQEHDPNHSMLSDHFTAEVAGSTLWWTGDSGNCSLFVVTSTDEVHQLASAAKGSIRSEQLDQGDRAVFVSESMTDALSNIDLALEMALGDDPTPAASCTWLLDAADDDGACEGMFVAIWRASLAV